jgi:hypothetical protein
MMMARLGSLLPGMDATSLANLRRGLMLLRWAVLVGVIGFAALLAGLTALMLFFDDGSDTAIEGVLGFVFVMAMPVGMLLGGLCWVIGWLLVDRGFDDAVFSGAAPRARRVMRRFLVGGVLLFCVAFVLGSWRAASVAAMPVLAVSALMFGVSTFAGMWMIRSIGTRTLEGRLVGGATQLMVASPLVVLWGVATYIKPAFGSASVSGSQVGWLDTVLGLVPCVAVLWPIGFVLLVDRLWRLTRRATAVIEPRG